MTDAAHVPPPGPNDLTLTRQIAASPDAVYRCWTDPKLIDHWFAPAPGTVPEAEIEAWPGGKFRVVMEFEEHGRMDGEPGCVLIAEPGRRFAWTTALRPGFRPSENTEDIEFTADVVLTPKDGGCEYTVIARHRDAEMARRHDEMGFTTGWGQCADQLAAFAATL